MKIYFLFFIILVLFFLPIPIMFNISYDNGLKFYLYKKNISSPKKSKRNKSKKNKNAAIDVKYLIFTLQNNKIKPSLDLTTNISYSLDDAALTAISTGAFSAILDAIYLFLSTFIKLKKSSYKLNPLFNEDKKILLSVKGIFYLSIANVLYLIFKLKKHRHFK